MYFSYNKLIDIDREKNDVRHQTIIWNSSWINVQHYERWQQNRQWVRLLIKQQWRLTINFPSKVKNLIMIILVSRNKKNQILIHYYGVKMMNRN